jgi:hypothetical protein
MLPAPSPPPRQGAAGEPEALPECSCSRPAGSHLADGGGSQQPHGADGRTTLLSTTLKWSAEGELSALDLHRIVARLADADPVASHLSLHHFGLGGREKGVLSGLSETGSGG